MDKETSTRILEIKKLLDGVPSDITELSTAVALSIKKTQAKMSPEDFAKWVGGLQYRMTSMIGSHDRAKNEITEYLAKQE